MSARRSTSLAAALTAALAIQACGGQTVEPLDPRDATLPPETRHWIADAQDGVIVARAQRNAMARQLAELEQWRERMFDVQWSGGKAAAVASGMKALANARTEVAEAKLVRAEEFVKFSVAKYRLANAERAMLHDLAVYDLKPLREAAADAKKAMGKAGDETERRHAELDTATEKFWAAYAAHTAAGGQTISFWASGGPVETE